MSEIKESQLPIGQQVSSFRGLDTSQNSTLISVDDASLALGVNAKANATDVAKQFADRDTALTESLALKSDITYVDQQLLLKSDLKYVNQQLATKAAAIDYSSLIEQIVPGEFWLGTDGLRRQVFIRTFIGSVYNLPINQKIIIATGILHGYAVSGYIETTMKDNSRITTPMDFKNYTINYSTDTRDKSLGLYNLDMTYNDYKEVKYNLTFKYTKL